MDDKDRDYPATTDIEQYALLRTYIAGKLESLHQSKEASKYWTALVEDIDNLTKSDPKEAFKFAVKTLEPGTNAVDPSVHFREWWQGTALIILANQKVKPFIAEELAKENSSVTRSLESFLEYKPSETIKETKDLNPEDFNLVMAMVIINDQDKNLEPLSELSKKTQDILKDDQTKVVIDLFHSIPEDKELVEPLYKIIHTTNASTS